MKNAILLLVILGLAVCLILEFHLWYLQTHTSNKLETFFAIEKVKHASKEIQLKNIPVQHWLEFWIEEWEDGEKVSVDFKYEPPENASLGNKGETISKNITVYAAAKETSEDSEKYQIVMHFPDFNIDNNIMGKITMSFYVPTFSLSSKKKDTRWAFQFLEGDLVINGTEEIELLALSRCSDYGPELSRFSFARKEGRKQHTMVVKMQFLNEVSTQDD